MFKLLIIILIIVLALTFLQKNRFIGLGERIEYRKSISDLCNNTRDEYKNCEERVLNVIDLKEPGEYDFDKIIKCLNHPGNKARIDKNKFAELLNDMQAQPPNARAIEGFYNKLVMYDSKEECQKLSKNQDDCGLDVGTYVLPAREKTIFKIPHQGKTITDKADEIEKIQWVSGSGKINLHNVAVNLQRQGVKWVLLIAAGEQGLFDMYELYGFSTVLKGFQQNIWGDVWAYNTSSIMAGKVSDIVSKTTT